MSTLSNIHGVEQVIQGDERADLLHERCGDIVLIAKQHFWFVHDWWNDATSAPDYQPTVDIHRKPGYDPREMFLAKGWRGSKPRIALKLLAKKIGLTTLLDVIEMDPSVVQGSHGRTPAMGATSPIIIPPATITNNNPISATSFKELMLSWMELS